MRLCRWPSDRQVHAAPAALPPGSTAQLLMLSIGIKNQTVLGAPEIKHHCGGGQGWRSA
jgi:hypothetical protein